MGTKKWDKNTPERKKGKLSTIMNNYGVAGLGLICPGLFGPITTIIVGLLLVNKTSILMPYLITGIIIWSFLLTWAATTGFDLIKSWV